MDNKYNIININIVIVVMMLMSFLLLTSCSEQSASKKAMNNNKGSDAMHDQSAVPASDESPIDDQSTKALPKLQFNEALGGEQFDIPVGIRHAGDGSGRLFVIEKPGIIKVFSGNLNQRVSMVFLDIRSKVNSKSSEQGLLGLAFHPNYKDNGLFYVNYTTEQGTVIESYQTQIDNPNKADKASGRILLEFSQPYNNHNGGELAFGPDGYLYIATGDGGSGGDPKGNGQKLTTLLGKILRIDVNHTTEERSYSIPVDNPFYNNSDGFKEEIYAYGLRNPWRFSFDRETGKLWAADVGQNTVEEIDIIERGHNYGWNTMEGSLCFNPKKNCKQTSLTPPIWEYNPKEGGASITGGYVYRGKEIPTLIGKYIFADFIDGRIWTLSYDEGSEVNVELLELELSNITSFGEDEAGELYACLYDGRIVRLSSAP